MELSVRGKRALVTAAGRGIGLAIAEKLLIAGAHVHVCDLDAESLAACRAWLPELGTTVADVADPRQVDRLFDEVVARIGGLDILVNNAGIAGPAARVEETAPQDWIDTFAVNIHSHFYCARRAIPALRTAGGGSIVNLSSAAGLFGYPLRAPYATSKWAVIGFTKTLAMELGEYGIRANAICPGPVSGPRMDAVISARALAKGLDEETVRAEYRRQNSMGTFIEAEEIANLVLFLCSDAGRHISGQALSVDGHTESLRT